jgi:hypothetical protein
MHHGHALCSRHAREMQRSTKLRSGQFIADRLARGPLCLPSVAQTELRLMSIAGALGAGPRTKGTVRPGAVVGRDGEIMKCVFRTHLNADSENDLNGDSGST